METMILCFVICPVLWLAIGAFCAGVFAELESDLPFEVKMLMIALAPVTLVMLLVVLIYLGSTRLSSKIVRAIRGW